MARILHSAQPAGTVSTVSLPSSAPTTLVVDGNYLLKCSYHATCNTPSYTVGGRNIGAVCEYLRKLRELLKRFNATKCVVFWDGEHGGKLRHNIYQYYKANRKNKDWYRGTTKTAAQAAEDERSQRSIEAQKVTVQNYLEELFVRQTEQNMMEGDDMIAYYCQEFHEFERIIIFTNDRDACQEVRLNGVSVFLDNLKMEINRDNFNLHFPYHYTNAALVKVLIGDTSDNIKGVKGLGLPTLLEHFPEIKERTCTWQDIKQAAHAHCEKRRLGKQKPLQVLQNIVDGVAMRLHYGQEAPYAFGDELYRLNQQLMDLSTPMLTREAREDVRYTGTQVLNPAERGTKNLLPMMQRDTMLRFYNGDLRYFIEPFVPMALRERQLFQENAQLG
jgi:5'-3' exonuclease